jgi:hypothetical protein
VLAEELRRLTKKAESALSYSMNHERNIGRDSIDESMEEELFSTEMRLHDREKFLLGKITKQIDRLDADEIDSLRGLRRGDLVSGACWRRRNDAVHRCQGAERTEEQATEQAGRAGGFGRAQTAAAKARKSRRRLRSERLGGRAT